MNKNLDKYNAEQMKYIMLEIEELLHYWGYANEEGNVFGFFDYQGKATAYSRSRYDGFRRQNERTMNLILNKKFNFRDIKYPINKGDEGYKMIGEKKNIFDLASIQSVITIKE